MGPRPWGGTQNPGSWGVTLEWDNRIYFYNILIVFFIRHQKASILITFSIFKENEEKYLLLFIKTIISEAFILNFLFEILIVFCE